MILVPNTGVDLMYKHWITLILWRLVWHICFLILRWRCILCYRRVSSVLLHSGARWVTMTQLWEVCHYVLEITNFLARRDWGPFNFINLVINIHLIGVKRKIWSNGLECSNFTPGIAMFRGKRTTDVMHKRVRSTWTFLIRSQWSSKLDHCIPVL